MRGRAILRRLLLSFVSFPSSPPALPPKMLSLLKLAMLGLASAVAGQVDSGNGVHVPGNVPANLYEPLQHRLAFAGVDGMTVSWSSFTKLEQPQVACEHCFSGSMDNENRAIRALRESRPRWLAADCPSYSQMESTPVASTGSPTRLFPPHTTLLEPGITSELSQPSVHREVLTLSFPIRTSVKLTNLKPATQYWYMVSYTNAAYAAYRP